MSGGGGELKSMCSVGCFLGHKWHWLLKGKVSYLFSLPPLITSHSVLTTGSLPGWFLHLPPLDCSLLEAGTRVAMGLYSCAVSNSRRPCPHTCDVNGVLRVEQCTTWIAVLCDLSRNCNLYFYYWPIEWKLTTYWCSVNVSWRNGNGKDVEYHWWGIWEQELLRIIKSPTVKLNVQR